MHIIKVRNQAELNAALEKKKFDPAHSATTGDSAISCALGYKSKAKAANGSWLVLAEYDADRKVALVKAVQVDGKAIKADTFYQLKRGKFVKAKTK